MHNFFIQLRTLLCPEPLNAHGSTCIQRFRTQLCKKVVWLDFFFLLNPFLCRPPHKYNWTCSFWVSKPMRRVPINFLSLSLSTHYFKKISFKTQTEHTWLFGLFSTHNVAFNLRWFSSTQFFFLGRTLHEESMLLLICQITNETYIEARISYMTKRPNRNATEISKNKQKVLKNQQQQWKMNEST